MFITHLKHPMHELPIKQILCETLSKTFVQQNKKNVLLLEIL